MFERRHSEQRQNPIESRSTTDPGKIARLQKMAEAMRLMHEAAAQ
jgi:hypothetical protein